MIAMDELLTPADAARILRMTEYTVRKKLNSGEIEGFQLGGRWKIKREALRRYIDQQSDKKK